MNLYFLVEGKTEQKVYPRWISYLLPNISRVDSPDDVSANNYFLISGGGFPSLLDNHLKASVADVNSVEKYDFLIICLDSDNASPESRIQMVYDFIKEEKLILSCNLHVIVQKICMETWFMGNRTVYTRNPSQSFKPFSQFYDASINDPELMGKPDDFGESHSIYHYEYLKNMLSEKRIRYSKKNPRDVMQKYYLNELRKRTIDFPNQLSTLKEFIKFMDDIAK